MKNSDDSNSDFIARLAKICDNDRGKAACLRRYWSTTTRAYAYQALGSLGALGDHPATLVAALYALHPSHQTGQGIGTAALKLGERKEGEHPYDRHFRRLLACEDLMELAPPLHRLVKRLATEGKPLDYTELLKQLRFWENGYSQGVKITWAKQFWQASIDTNPVP